MVTIQLSIDIQRPVEIVFAYVSDPRNVPRRQGPIKEVYMTPAGSPAVGTKVTEIVSFLGMKLEPTGEITVFEPNRSFSFTARAGSATLEATYRFEAVGTGTRLSATFQVEPGGLFRGAGPLVQRQFRRQLEADCQRIKELLEAQQA